MQRLERDDLAAAGSGQVEVSPGRAGGLLSKLPVPGRRSLGSIERQSVRARRVQLRQRRGRRAHRIGSQPWTLRLAMMPVQEARARKRDGRVRARSAKASVGKPWRGRTSWRRMLSGGDLEHRSGSRLPLRRPPRHLLSSAVLLLLPTYCTLGDGSGECAGHCQPCLTLS